MKIAIVHAQKQHSIYYCNAFKNSEFDWRFYTLIYYKNNILSNILYFFLSRNLKIKFKKNKFDVPDKYIYSNNLIGFLYEFLNRSHLKLFNNFSKLLLNSWYRKIAFKLIKNKYDLLISFDFNSLVLYDTLTKCNSKIFRVLDLSAPSYDFFLSYVIKNDSEQYDFDLNERFNSFNKHHSSISNFEIANANHFICASTFSKKSLEFKQIPSKNISIFWYPYNGEFKDIILFNKPELLNVIFVGKMTKAKSFNVYVEIVKELNNDKNLLFSAVGKYNKNSKYYSNNRNYIDFLGFLEKKALNELLKRSNIIIFPSFSDGFGLSVIEAMAMGVIPIVSKYAGVSDLIINDFNGYIFDPLNKKNSIELIISLTKDREKMTYLSNNAIKTVKNLNPEVYKNQIINLIRSLK